MTTHLLSLLLLLSFPLLCGLGGAGLLISNAERRQQALSRRIARALPRGPRPAAAASIARGRATGSSLSIRAAGWFGCDLQRAQTYPVRWWIVLLGTAALGRLAAAAALPLFGPLAWLSWPAVWISCSRALFSRWDAQRRNLLQQQFPDALATIIRSVRVGVPVSEAIRLVGHDSPDPTGEEFRELANALSIGVPLEVALRAVALRAGLPDYRFFGTAIALQAQTGGMLSEALENLGEIVRRRIGLRARGYALTSEARASAMVLCAMPFVAAGMMYLLTPAYMTVLFSTETGHKMLGVAAISMTVGVVTMRGLIGKVLQ
ncbi:MAG TPA: type II secretion system F family protein [Acetobacteraceae bacterium]|nr:type II secretion system F family protein [Acetobacteraceae bacterium]